jgi:hypothetical protein
MASAHAVVGSKRPLIGGDLMEAQRFNWGLVRKMPAKNAWVILGRAPLVKIELWRRQVIPTAQGEVTVEEYDSLNGTTVRYYQKLIFPNGTHQWRYALGRDKISARHREEFEENWERDHSTFNRFRLGHTDERGYTLRMPYQAHIG